MPTWKPAKRSKPPVTTSHQRISPDFFNLTAKAIYALTIESGEYVSLRQAMVECVRRLSTASPSGISSILHEYERARYSGARIVSFHLDADEVALFDQAKSVLSDIYGSPRIVLDVLVAAMLLQLRFTEMDV